MAQNIKQLSEQINGLKQQLAELRRQAAQGPVEDYELHDLDGKPVKLSALFQGKDDLIVIHNMGQGCAYCTLWADGFTGLTPHLSDRAAFVLVSADEPEKAKAFSQGRGWNFRVLSGTGSTFTSDMGFASGSGGTMPGISTFSKTSDGTISRVSSDFFGPGDDYCALWYMIAMLKDGDQPWTPKYSYPD